MEFLIFTADCRLPFVQIQSEQPESLPESSFFTEFQQPKIGEGSVSETVYDNERSQYVRVCKVSQMCEVIRVATFIELATGELTYDSEFEKYLVPVN